MTVVIESDYVIALKMRSGWFILVLVTFWQIIHCSLQTKINKKAVMWQRNRTKFTAASHGILFLCVRKRRMLDHFCSELPQRRYIVVVVVVVAIAYILTLHLLQKSKLPFTGSYI